MLCPNCQRELPKNAASCPYCGTTVKKRGKGALWGTIFVIFFVLIVSSVLIFMNLKFRGELSSFSFSSIRSLFVGDRAEPSEAEPAGEPAGEPEPAEEPVAEPEPAEEPPEESAPDEEPEAVPTDTEPAPAGDAVLTTLDAYKAAERAESAQLIKAWAACRAADETAADALLQGDAGALLRLCLSRVLGEEKAAKLTVDSADEPESRALFSSDANAVFGALLASEGFDALLEEYGELILSQIGEAVQGEEHLEAEGIVEPCEGSFRVDLDGAALQRIAASLIGTLRWDARISGILSEADYESFLARLDELDYALDRAGFGEGDALHMVLYLTADGQFRGRGFTLERADGVDRFLLALPRQGETLGLELSLRDAAGIRTLSGRGSLTEDAFSGSFRFLRDGKRAAGLEAGLTE